MENTPHLYDTLVLVLSQHATWVNQRHLKTLAWMMVGLIHSGWINLPAWAPYVVSRAQYAQSPVRRFRRWLDNDKIDALSLYGPLIEQALGPWGEQGLYVALDTSMLVEYLLSDPAIGELSRPGCPPGGVCAPTWQCAGGVQGLPRPSGESGPPVASALHRDLSGRSRVCGYRADGVSPTTGLALADSDQEELLALSLRASALQSRAPRCGPRAGLFLAAGVHHQKALWSGASRRGPPVARAEI